MPDSAVSAFINWLRERHTAIMDCEKAALAALYEKKDEEDHRRLMLRKGELVAALDREAAPCLEALPPGLRERAASALTRFSNSARNGLRIGSVFYMSALLYPDEHKEGEPDNLMLFIQELEQA